MSRTALVVIDMINAYDFPDAEKLVASAEEAAPAHRGAHRRPRRAPVIYVNDNFGHWRSHRDELIEEALEGEHPELVEPIEPADDALFVIKARHSIFYETPLEYLLRPGGRRHVVLIGQVTEQCILYSALDAYIRHFKVARPARRGRAHPRGPGRSPRSR